MQNQLQFKAVFNITCMGKIGSNITGLDEDNTVGNWVMGFSTSTLLA